MTRARLLRGLLLSIAALGGAPAAGWAAPADQKDAETELTVFAAASLREAFDGLATAFEHAHPKTKVRLNLAGSQELRTQIEQGARADVLASADLKHMATLEKAGLVGKSVTFARNEPVIVVPRGNPAGIHALAELPKTKRLVVGAPEVPIGAYTVRIFDAVARKYGPELRAKLEASVVSRELNVRQVLAKVTLGEADAGIVYRTDAQAAKDKVEVIAIPSELNAIPEYPIAVLAAAPAPRLARAWVEAVLSAQGQRRMAATGFLPATTPTPTPTRPPARAPAPPQQGPTR